MPTLETAPASVPPRNVAESTARLRALHRRFHRDTERLARLCREAGLVAAREPEAILSAARADIRRVLDEARTAVAELAAVPDLFPPAETLESAIPPDFDPKQPGIEFTIEAESLRRIRSEVQDLLEAARARSQRVVEGETASDALPIKDADAPIGSPTPTATVTPTPHDPVFDSASVLFRDQSLPARSFETPLAMAVAVGGAIVLGTGAMWMAGAFRSRIEPAKSSTAPARRTDPELRATGAPGVVESTATSSLSSKVAQLQTDRTGPLTLWLHVEARRTTRIRSAIDSGAAEDLVMQPGESRRLMAAESVTLWSNDAGALNVSFNGGGVSAFGGDGQAVTRRYTIADAPKLSDRRALPPDRPAAVPGSGMAAAYVPPFAPGRAVSQPPPISGAAVLRASDRTRVDPEVVELDSASRMQVIALGQQWLDAYYRGDGNTMNVMADPGGVELQDERSGHAKFPDNLSGVVRTLTDLRTDRRGDYAIVRATMTESAFDNAIQLRVVSAIMQTWRRSAGRWCLAQARLSASAR